MARRACWTLGEVSLEAPLEGACGPSRHREGRRSPERRASAGPQWRKLGGIVAPHSARRAYFTSHRANTLVLGLAEPRLHQSPGACRGCDTS